MGGGWAWGGVAATYTHRGRQPTTKVKAKEGGAGGLSPRISHPSRMYSSFF